MGSGLSDLNTISSSTLHKEISTEFRKLQVEHEEAVNHNAVIPDRVKLLEDSFSALGDRYHEYDELYKHSSDNTSALIEKALAVNEAYREYRDNKALFVYQVGDIVQVRDDEIPTLFVEGVVFDIEDDVIRVKVNEDCEEDMMRENEQIVSREVKAGSSDIRKVRPWDYLEPGDRVRVKEGCLYFQGIVVSVSEDSKEVTVDFGDKHDTHNVNDDDAGSVSSEESAEDMIKTVHIRFVEKIDTKRIAMIRFKDYVRRIQKSILVARAFQGGLVNELEKRMAAKQQNDQEPISNEASPEAGQQEE